MSLTNVFNDVIGQSNQTKTFGSGLNQKRFSGKVSTAAVNMGNTKGRGSTTRMYNYCTQNSETPSNCINQFISFAAAPVPAPFDPNSNILFDISSFSDKFNSRTGNNEKIKPYGNPNDYYKLPENYIIALTNAANRWNKLIKFSPNVNSFLNSSLQNLNPNYTWKGIQLFKAEIINESSTVLASASPNLLQTTTFPLRFSLVINFGSSITYFNVQELSNFLTHELGHALGLPAFLSLKNGNGEQLQTYMSYFPQLNASGYPGSILLDPLDPTKILDVFPNALQAYNQYGCVEVKTGTKNLKVTVGNNFIPLKHSGDSGMKNKHWENETLQYTDTQNYTYYYSGFDNELMISYFYRDKNMLISKITLNLLTDIYSSFNNIKYYNYTVLNSNSEVTKADKNPDTKIITFEGSIQPYSNNKGLLCLDCDTKNFKNENYPVSYALNCQCTTEEDTVYITMEEFASENPDV